MLSGRGACDERSRNNTPVEAATHAPPTLSFFFLCFLLLSFFSSFFVLFFFTQCVECGEEGKRAGRMGGRLHLPFCDGCSKCLSRFLYRRGKDHIDSVVQGKKVTSGSVPVTLLSDQALKEIGDRCQPNQRGDSRGQRLLHCYLVERMNQSSADKNAAHVSTLDKWNKDTAQQQQPQQQQQPLPANVGQVTWLETPLVRRG